MKQALRLAAAALAALLPCTTPAHAQEKGAWRAASKTARSLTGDLAFSDIKIAINFASFPIAQIRALTPAEAVTLFHTDEASPGAGNLFRLSIPGDKKFLHKNTLCGSEETQWAVTWVEGRTLQLAFFSTATMPSLTPEALASNTTLCGTFTYVR
ncbi:MAG TPA: hypothetical protein VM865_06465 [Acidobacteriaceae bacterium]|jgi:hypothetical protein|nr:hypothetical protein [Acidobacteriaceae bacterium]